MGGAWRFAALTIECAAVAAGTVRRPARGQRGKEHLAVFLAPLISNPFPFPVWGGVCRPFVLRAFGCVPDRVPSDSVDGRLRAAGPALFGAPSFLGAPFLSE